MLVLEPILAMATKPGNCIMDSSGLLAALLVVGCLLFLRGLRGHRVGEDPRCRKCKYLLIGLLSAACPECGANASGRNIIRGEKHYGRYSLILGLFVLLTASAAFGSKVYDLLKNKNLYPYYPTAYVVHKTEENPQASEELIRRFRNETLSDRWLAELPRIAFDQMKTRETPRTITENWTELLTSMDRRSVLTKADQKSLYDLVVLCGLELLPASRSSLHHTLTRDISEESKKRWSIYQDEDLQITLFVHVRGIDLLEGQCRIELLKLKIGDRTIESRIRQSGHVSESGQLSIGTGAARVAHALSLTIPLSSPILRERGFLVPAHLFGIGTYNVECLVRKTFLFGPGGTLNSPPLTNTRLLRTELVVLPPKYHDSVGSQYPAPD